MKNKEKYDFFLKVRKIIFFDNFNDCKKETLEIINSFNFTEKDFLINLILWNKLSPIFLKNFSFNELEIHFDKFQLEKIIFQQKRFQIYSMLVANEIKILSNFLKQTEILGIFLKGSSLFNFEYEDISLRPMMDIDLFIDNEKIYDFYTFLGRNGYFHLKNKKFFLNEKEFRNILEISHQVPTLTSQSGVSIELHNRVTHKHDFLDCPITKKVIDNYQIQEFMGSYINLPSPEDKLLIQVLHMFSYPTFKLNILNFFDIKHLIKKNRLNILKISKKIPSKKIKKEFLLINDLMNFFDLDITDHKSFESFIKNNSFMTNSNIFKQALDRIYSYPNSKIGLSHFTYLIGSSKNPIEFAKHLFIKTFPSKTYMMSRHVNPKKVAGSIKFYFYTFFIDSKKYLKDISIIFFKFIFFKKQLKQYQDFMNWFQKED